MSQGILICHRPQGNVSYRPFSFFDLRLIPLLLISNVGRMVGFYCCFCCQLVIVQQRTTLIPERTAVFSYIHSSMMVIHHDPSCCCVGGFLVVIFSALSLSLSLSGLSFCSCCFSSCCIGRKDGYAMLMMMMMNVPSAHVSALFLFCKSYFFQRASIVGTCIISLESLSQKDALKNLPK